MLKYNFENLSKKDLEFYKTLPKSLKLKYENLSEFIICHGSPFSVKEINISLTQVEPCYWEEVFKEFNIA